MSQFSEDLNLEKKNLEEILNDPQIPLIKETLVSIFSPLHIYLFGSRVYGKYHEHSDYDLAVVVNETTTSRGENMQKAREALSKIGISADVFVYPVNEFEDWKDELNSIPEAAYHLGVEIPLG